MIKNHSLSFQAFNIVMKFEKNVYGLTHPRVRTNAYNRREDFDIKQAVGGGLVVTVLAYYSDNLSSNPAFV